MPGHGAQALKWRCSQTPGTKNVHKQLGKGNSYREISSKFGVVASTACEKVNAMGTDENLFGLSACAQAQCPSTTSGASACAQARCPN